ncbi:MULTISPECIES: glycosyltransferase 87 family protein [Clostridium]|uniref:glycosyltransferase 87 family protein n=1 Tax=Clostridium TaxID=1485 RepID=UPI000824BAED|nr:MULTISPECIES: glycosyltransferase 87 family protein [Clostridium]
MQKNAIKIIISFIIFVLSIVCIYSLATYKNNTTSLNMTGSTFNKNRPNFSPNYKPNRSANKAVPNMKQSSSNKKSPNNGFRNVKNSFKGQMPNSGGMGMPNSMSSSSNTNYSHVILAYALAFFVLIIAAYLILIRKKIKISNENRGFIIIGVLIIGLLFRIKAGLNITGYSMDLNLYQNWASSAAKNLLTIYNSDSTVDYPPVYLYVLFIVGKLASLSFMSKYYVLLLKLPSILVDIASAYFIYKISKKYFSFEVSGLLSIFYLFNPAVLIDSTIWGQADSFFTLLIILAVYFLSEDRIIQSSVFFAISVLMKPQGIIFLPLLLFWYIKQKNLKSFLKSAASGIITALIIIAPFSIAQGSITWIFNLYMKEVSEYPYASDNAFNFYNLIGANKLKDSTTLFLFSYHTWGMIFIVLITILSGILYFKSKNRYTIILAAFIQITGVFVFSVGMHERYMFTAVFASILSFIYLKDKRLLILSVILSITNYLNMHIVLFSRALSLGTGSNTFIITTIISLLNVIAFIYLVKVSIDICIKNKKFIDL